MACLVFGAGFGRADDSTHDGTGSEIAGRAPRKVDPAKILRARVKNADLLKVIAYSSDNLPKVRTLISVSDSDAIADLLKRIETELQDTDGTTGHGCVDSREIRFFRKGRLLAAVSIDHSHILNARRPEHLFPGGIAFFTQPSRRAVAEWFHEHGLSSYLRDLTDVDAGTPPP